MSYTLPPLAYDYAALEPHIDARTMEIHYSRHHQTYVNNLNAALDGTEYQRNGLWTICSLKSNHCRKRCARRCATTAAVMPITACSGKSCLPKGVVCPRELLRQPLTQTWSGFENFKTEFTKAAISRFGSGWAWLGVDPSGKLHVESSANQDTPLMLGIGSGNTPILGLDVWEHAYYLKYQNRRPEYIAAFYNVVEWNEVARRFAAATQPSRS